MKKRLLSLMGLLVILSMILGACAQPAATTVPEETEPAVVETEPVAEETEPPAEETEAVAEETEPPAPEGPEPVTIVFYQRGYIEGGEDAGSITTAAAVEKFMAANPHITVEIVGIPWTAEGDTKLETALSARSDINVFRVTSPNLPRYSRQGVLSEITPYLTEEDKADFYESGFQVATVDGKVWAWPLWVTAISIFANTDIFEERGVELPSMDDPWTWEEFVDAAKQLTFEREDGTQVFGFTSSSKWGAVEYYPLMYIDGGRILSEDGTQFVQNSPEGVSALEKLASLALEHKVTPPDFGTVDQAGVRSQFKDIQNVAMLMSTPGFIPDLEKANFPLAVVPPPMGDAGRLVTNGAMGLYAVVDVEDDGQEEAAHLLGSYLTGSQVAKDIPGWQLAPGLRRSNTSYATNPSREVIAKLVEYGVYEVPVVVPAEVGTNYGAMLQAVILGEMTAQEAMDEIAPEYQAALDEGNQ
ncbi:MAG: sugar ABC transporter substrate-binding protein [Chloroflexi bacterium]|nr:MAG: sugar ABC transporter substrate-binding protein [Chloroflexota bacterium]